MQYFLLFVYQGCHISCNALHVGQMGSTSWENHSWHHHLCRSMILLFYVYGKINVRKIMHTLYSWCMGMSFLGQIRQQVPLDCVYLCLLIQDHTLAMLSPSLCLECWPPMDLMVAGPLCSMCLVSTPLCLIKISPQLLEAAEGLVIFLYCAI